MSLISDATGDNQNDPNNQGDQGKQNDQDNQGDQGKQNGNDNSEWNKGIDESMQERMGKFKDVNSLAKSYVELETKLGEGFKVPETDEEKAKLWARLGRPKDADSYELEDEDELGFKAHAFELGFSQDQVTRHAAWFKNVIARYEETQKEKSKASEVKLKEAWGEKYGDNMTLAERALSAIYSEDLIDRLEQGGFLDDQEFVAHLCLLGKRSADDSIGRNGHLSEVERTAAGQPYLAFPSMKDYD